MLASDYQKATQETAIYPKDAAILYLILGLASEAGEVAGKLAKAIRKDVINYAEIEDDIDLEMGDCLYMISQWCNETGTTLGALMEMNIKKLRDRKARGVLQGNGDSR